MWAQRRSILARNARTTTLQRNMQRTQHLHQQQSSGMTALSFLLTKRAGFYEGCSFE
jgi:hypothetical protein